MIKATVLLVSFFLVLLSSSVVAQWNQIPLNPPSGIFSLYTFDNTIYAGGDSILYYSTDSGNEWLRSSRIENVEHGITSIEKWNNKLFVGTAGRGVFESSDDGITWSALNNGLTGTGALEISSMAIRGDSLYAGTVGEGVFVLNLLNPSEWVTFRDGLTFGVSWNVYSLYNFNGALICGAGGNAKVYINEYGTSSWIEKSFDSFSGDYNSMLGITNCGDVIIGCANLGIYRSLNNGVSWEYYNPEIGLISFASFAVVNSVTVAVISKVDTSYLLSSVDSGAYWQFEFEFSSTNFAITYLNDKIFSGRGDGLFYLPYRPSSFDDEINFIQPTDFLLKQNYPNPFNPKTVIGYQLPFASKVTLKVYDLLGREVATLVNEEQKPGVYKIEFKPESSIKHMPSSRQGPASGVYFYRLQVEGYTETKKMIILR